MADTAPNAFSALPLFNHFIERTKKKRSARLAAPATFCEVLEGAEQLLIHATEAGILIEPEISLQIISAKRDATAWKSPEAVELIGAIATLAAKVRPITARSLESGRDIANQERKYARRATLLVALIIPLSMVSFITSGLSTSISTDIAAANSSAVTLHTQLDSPPPKRGAAPLDDAVPAPAGALSEVQQFASTIRSIKDHASMLNIFLFNMVPAASLPIERRVQGKANPYELNPDKWISLGFLQHETNKKTFVFQEVRRYAKEVQDYVSLIYGAIGTYLLPMLYAALGVCAYLLRLFQRELRSETFSNRYDISARFFVAIIGGFIVGQFSSFAVTGASLSPLALAFLVGYAADVFFSFLEGLVANFRKPAAPTEYASAHDDSMAIRIVKT